MHYSGCGLSVGVVIYILMQQCCHGFSIVMVSSNHVENTRSQYLEEGEGAPGKPAIGNQVEAAITSSFLVLIGIFFPSVTGELLHHL